MPINHVTLYDHGIPWVREEHTNDQGKWHRVDGPALIAPGLEAYYIDGLPHREGGPAIVDGDYKAWFLHGVAQRVEHITGRVYVKET